MGKRSEQAFFQRKYTDGQQIHEKMFNITKQKNTNQIKRTMKYPLIPVKMAIMEKTKKKEMLVRIWIKENESFCTLLVGM